MGTWDTGIFDNDTACDWVYKLEKTCDLSLVEETLDRVLGVGDGRLIIWHSDEGLAAAETIARLQGNPGPKTIYTRNLDRWVSKNKLVPTTELARKAVLAIHRILAGPSDILEAWFEETKFGEWKKNVENLTSRIRC